MLANNLSLGLMALVIALVGPASGLPEPASGRLEQRYAHMSLTPMTWVGKVKRDGENVTLVGDYKTIRSAIAELNPNYERDFPTETLKVRDLESRDDYKSHWPPTCEIFADAWVPDVQNNANILRGLQGNIAINSRTCIVPECTNNAQVRVCNDADNTVYIPCAQVAVFTFGLLNACTEPSNHARGQLFADRVGENWNVIVSDASAFNEHC